MSSVIFMHLSEFCNPLYTNYVLYHLRIWNGGKGGGLDPPFLKLQSKITENMPRPPPPPHDKLGTPWKKIKGPRMYM